MANPIVSLTIFLFGLSVLGFGVVAVLPAPSSTSGQVLSAETSAPTSFHVSWAFDQVAYDRLFAQTSSYPLSGQVLGGNVPHHLLAAPMIASWYQSLSTLQPEVIVLVGPDHYHAGLASVTTTDLSWQTPFGQVDLYPANSSSITLDRQLFDREHSIKVQIPFIRRLFPQAKLLPLCLKNGQSIDTLSQLAASLHQSLPDNTLMLSSVDFSHHATQKEAGHSDTQTIQSLSHFNSPALLTANVDSPASLALLSLWSQLRGANNFQLFDQTDGSRFGADPASSDLTSYVTFVYSR